MQIEYDKLYSSNLDLKQMSEFSSAFLGIVKYAIISRPYDLDLSLVNNDYKNEKIITVYCDNKADLQSAHFFILTNFRLLKVNFSALQKVALNELDSRDIKNAIFLINLESCQDRIQSNEYTTLQLTANNEELQIAANNEEDTNFINNNLRKRLLIENSKIVDVYNDCMDKFPKSKPDLGNIQIISNELNSYKISERNMQGTINTSTNLSLKSEIKRPADKSVAKTNITKKEHEQRKYRCPCSFGPAPEGFYLEDIICAQGKDTSDDPNFTKAMDKAVNTIINMLDKDEVVCNMKFTTQNTESYFSVNLAGDLYKKDN